MIADVTHFTAEEGGDLITWQFKPHIKPSNPELLTKSIPMVKARGCLLAIWRGRNRHDGVKIAFHSLHLSDGSAWDCVNGFRDNRGAR